MRRACRVLLGGGVVAYPTEAVYGLGCLPQDRGAVERVLAIKQRSWTKGLVLIAADAAQLEPLVELPGGPAGREILASWPGPVTWVLPARHWVPAWMTGGRGSLAVRVTAHPIAKALCAGVGQPLVSTSANLSRRAPLKTALGVRRAFGSLVDYVLAGPLGDSDRPTEIRDGASGRVLRPG